MSGTPKLNRRPRGFRLSECSFPASGKQPLLPFNDHSCVNAFQKGTRRDLPKLFGLDFVKAAAVDSAFRSHLAGLNPFQRFKDARLKVGLRIQCAAQAALGGHHQTDLWATA